MRSQSRVLHTALVSGLLIGLLTYAWIARSGSVSPDAIRRAALQQDWEAVVALTDALPVSGSEAERTMLLRAEALLEQQRFADSYQLLEGFTVSEVSAPDALLHLQARAAFETGRLDTAADLFVTNFRDEPNTLYTQNPGRLFLDTTRSSGLRGASVAWVGWGTQFLDANNNGREDLVVVNGHVDAHPEHEGGYAMPPQLFRSTAERTFDLHQARETGDFFAQTLVGRSVVRLDWNTDGRPDFAVSTLTSHARLATNTTHGAGRSLQIRLVGTQSARDAIGSQVSVHLNGQAQYRQLVAGDGYMASNERVLIFGTARHEVAERVQITWPSGRQSTFENLATDRQYTVIEPKDSRTPARIVVQ
ncbi:MAG: ASPIC/UnbV domain-containing protein [Planctomycetaceae bacterium]|nr:ASPIC/UnbV domain-containing protein [Planctomycetaceae bacterium]